MAWRISAEKSLRLEAAIRTLLANILWLLHMAVLGFVIFGWLLPPGPWLYSHLVFLPLMMIHWKTNDDRCILTVLEAGLRQKVSTGDRAAEGPPFVASLIASVTGKTPPENLLNRFIYTLVFTSFGLTIGRLLINS